MLVAAQVSAQAGRIEDYSPAFDIGVAVHACGLATDYAQLQCVARRVPYLLVPCCVGKINIDVSVASRYSYPRAQKLFSPQARFSHFPGGGCRAAAWAGAASTRSGGHCSCA